MEKIKKSKKKIKTISPLSSQRLEKFEKIGVPLELKSSKRLIEINRNGNRIIANWKNDQINGEAEIYYHNGVTFKYNVLNSGACIKMALKSKGISSSWMGMSISGIALEISSMEKDRWFFHLGR